MLIVEGSQGSAAPIRQALEAAGFQCVLASSVPDAVQQTMDTTFTAAFVELVLPTESGLAVLTHFRSDSVEVPVLLYGPADAGAVALAAWHGGADDVLLGPIEPDELLARFARRLELAERCRALREARDELEALSTTDGLTQTANHRAFHERLAEEFRRAQRYDDPLAVILMDVDHFKLVNDTHGHLVGDEVLRLLAAAIKTAVRETDFVARYGGEEFGVLLPKTHLAGALTVAERMSAALQLVRAGADSSVRVTASFGVAGYPGRGIAAGEHLLKAADDALYRSKREGRNKISLFQPSLFVARAAPQS